MNFPIVQVNWKSVHISQYFCMLRNRNDLCFLLDFPGMKKWMQTGRVNSTFLLGVFCFGLPGYYVLGLCFPGGGVYYPNQNPIQ